MGRYVSNAKSILNNGPVFQCVIWNKKTGKSVALNAMIDTGGLFTTIDVDIAIELDLDVVGRQGLRSYNDVDGSAKNSFSRFLAFVGESRFLSAHSPF